MLYQLFFNVYQLLKNVFNVNFFFNFWERARVGEGQKQRGDRGFEVGSALTGASLMRGLNPRTVRSWLEPKLDAQLSEPHRRPALPTFSVNHLLVLTALGKNIVIISKYGNIHYPYNHKDIKISLKWGNNQRNVQMSICKIFQYSIIYNESKKGNNLRANYS